MCLEKVLKKAKVKNYSMNAMLDMKLLFHPFTPYNQTQRQIEN